LLRDVDAAKEGTDDAEADSRTGDDCEERLDPGADADAGVAVDLPDKDVDDLATVEGRDLEPIPGAGDTDRASRRRGFGGGRGKFFLNSVHANLKSPAVAARLMNMMACCCLVFSSGWYARSLDTAYVARVTPECCSGGGRMMKAASRSRQS
jgi:hypothetical protein